MTLKRYTTRPHVVEAMLLTVENMDEAAKLCGGRIKREEKPGDPSDVSVRLQIPSLESRPPVASPGSYLIRDTDTGEFYVRSKSNFESEYFAVGQRQDGVNLAQRAAGYSSYGDTNKSEGWTRNDLD